MYEFEFKGGVAESQSMGRCKFLLFLLNGDKEISLSNAIKYGFVKNRVTDSYVNWSPHSFMSDLPIVKVVMYEDGGFGHERLSQSFYLVLGRRLERQVITITPKCNLGTMQGYVFRADASFMKKSEVLSLLDNNSVSAKVLMRQQQPPVSVLKQIIKIERFGLPKEAQIASSTSARKLRIR